VTNQLVNRSCIDRSIRFRTRWRQWRSDWAVTSSRVTPAGGYLSGARTTRKRSLSTDRLQTTCVTLTRSVSTWNYDASSRAISLTARQTVHLPGKTTVWRRWRDR